MARYCPECRSGYEDSVSKCPGCGQALKPASEIPPYCPSCGKTFRIGDTICRDCLVELSFFSESEDAPPAEGYVEMETIYETSDLVEISLIKGALEAAKIIYNVRNENAQNLLGLGLIGGFNPLAGFARIDVDITRKTEAIELIQRCLGKE